MANNDKKETKSTESSSAAEKLSEAIKKIISSGSPAEISKEILATVFGQALKAKDDITIKVSNEMISLIKKIDFINEFSKFTETHKFKVTAEIEIIKKENHSKE